MSEKEFENLPSAEVKVGQPLVSVKNLVVEFAVRGRTLTAIRNVSLDIYKGEMIGCFQDFANLTKICNVNDNINFIEDRKKVLKKMPVCNKCNFYSQARK